MKENITIHKVEFIPVLWVKIYVVGSLVALGIAVAFWGYIAINRVYNDASIRVAQIGVLEAQKENVGKPQMIEQRYFAPTK